MIRDQKLTQTTNLVIHDVQGGNPLNSKDDGGALENAYMWKGKIVRISFPPAYFAFASANKVWRLIPFQFTRNSAIEQQLIIIKSDGKTYRLQGGEMEQNISCPVNWVRKPSYAIVSNRLHISDGVSYYIWDGYYWVAAGLTAPLQPSTSFSGTGLTGLYNFATTWVVEDPGGTVRIHESSRSAVAAANCVNQGVQLTVSSPPARATHWSVYMSEVAGSSVLRRAATISVNTSSYTASAEPSSTSPQAPVRNDPVQPSKILTLWKNRIAMRSETNPDQFWFTAFGEVAGLLNGAPEECLPGRSSSSISDLVNEWTISDQGRPMNAAVFHDDFLFIFTDRTGFAVIGSGAVLDNIGSRDFQTQRQFPYGAAGPFACCSTPKGLATLTPEHKLWFWPNSGEPIDIGIAIQPRLDSLTQSQLQEAEMLFWNGNGHNWLLLTIADRIQVFDFDVTTQDYPAGTWWSLGSQSALPQPTALCIWNPDGEPVLLSGHSDGSVHQLLDVCQPAHLGLAANLGFCYLGSTVQNSPTTLIRSGPIASDNPDFVVANYLQYYQIGTGDTSSISTSNPTVTAYYDTPDPRTPQNGVTLTSNTVPKTNERRAWFAPSGGSGAGALCGSFQVELKWTTTDTDGQTRPQLINNEVWDLAVSHTEKSPTAL